MNHRLIRTSRMRRIAMLSIHSSPTGALGTQNTGGMSVYIKALAGYIGAGGDNVDIYTCVPGRHTIEVIGSNVRLIHLFSARENLDKEHLSSQVERIFQRMEHVRRNIGINYDIIHSHYWISGLVGELAKSKWHCPHIIMFHTLGLLKNRLAEGENEPQERIDHERRLSRSVHGVLVPTKQERDHLVDHYQADPAKISIIPCGVDLDLFQPRDKSVARRRLGISTSAEVLLFVGRFVPLKGVDRLINVVAELMKTGHPDIKLMMIGGDGPDEESTRMLQSRIEQNNLMNNIHLAGRIEHEQLPCYYAAADLMVLPSQYESFGLVVLEALACGLPVAATPVGAAREVVCWRKNGVLFKSPGTEDITIGIQRLLAWVNSHAASPQQIRASAMCFSWNRTRDLVIRTYDLILDHHVADSNIDRSVCSNC